MSTYYLCLILSNSRKMRHRWKVEAPNTIFTTAQLVRYRNTTNIIMMGTNEIRKNKRNRRHNKYIQNKIKILITINIDAGNEKSTWRNNRNPSSCEFFSLIARIYWSLPLLILLAFPLCSWFLFGFLFLKLFVFLFFCFLYIVFLMFQCVVGDMKNMTR